MKKDKKTLIMRIFAVVLIMGLTVSVGIITLAEFTKSDRAMRVVATYGKLDSLFSSNYLVYSESVDNKRTIYVSSASTNPEAAVFICNYAQGNPAKTYENNIPYRVTAKWVIYNIGAGTITDATSAEVDDVTVTLTLNNGTAVVLDNSTRSTTFNSTLSRLESASDLLNIEFDKKIFDNSNDLRLEVVAEPIGAYYDIYPLRCLFNAAVRGLDEQLTWEGYFNEAGAMNTSGTPIPSTYDGFNYVITGTGSGSVTLRWKSDKVSISDVFIVRDMNNITITNEADNWKSVTFSVDSDTINRYDLQFYKADGTLDTDFASWSTVKDYVEFSFS